MSVGAIWTMLYYIGILRFAEHYPPATTFLQLTAFNNNIMHAATHGEAQ